MATDDGILCCTTPIGFTPEQCIAACDKAIKNWTESWIRGERWNGAIGVNWSSYSEAIAEWKKARDFWEAKL